MNQTDSSSEEVLTPDAACSAFVAEWESGTRPDIKQYLARVPKAERREALMKLISEDVSRRKGVEEKPSLEDYLELFPEDGATISAAFDLHAETMSSTVGGSHAEEQKRGTAVSIGENLGKYEIRTILGKGGMGVVFGAFDPVINREVAIKLLSSKHSGDENATSRLLKEAQTAGSLQHPNIVAIYDVVVDERGHFVVMEKVNGKNLSDVIWQSTNGMLDWREATRIMIDCCNALIAAHERGLIHRDIKPQNIMLTEESQAKLLDFGLAKAEQSNQTALTTEGTVLGTPDFMSPEQCRAEEVKHLTDLYSLGATYFALLTGHAPFRSQGHHLKVMYAHCNEPVPNVQEDNPEIPAGCDTVIQRAMAKKTEDRYQSAREIRTDLEELLRTHGSNTIVAESAAYGALPGAPKKPIPKSLIGAGLAIVIAIGGLFFVNNPFADRRNADGAGVSPADVPLEDPKPASLFRGVTADSITLGTTTAFNGPNGELGESMVVGMRTCFREVNENGGIHGRDITLTALDDRYEPERALKNMEDLFGVRDVFGVIGNVGTPTARVTAPYASENGYLFFAPFTGASLLREDPPDRYIFNYRASYADETEALVKHFVVNMKIPAENIAVFAQNDAYGDDGFRGVVKIMRSYNISEDQILRVGYERNDLKVDEAVTQILDDTDEHDVQAIVMVPTYKVAANFVKNVRLVKPDMQFGTVSFVGSKALAEEFQNIGSAYGEGVVVTQVVPHYMSNATGVLRYRKQLAKHYPEAEPGFVSLEGFIAAECLVEGLKKAGAELNTESLIDALHQMKELDLGIGPVIQFSPSDHQASHKVWGTKLDASGRFVNIELVD